MATLALVATSPSAYEADVADRIEQRVTLSAEYPSATTVVRLVATADTMPATRQHLAVLSIASRMESSLEPNPAVVVTVTDGSGREIASGPSPLDADLDRFCTQGMDCQADVTIAMVLTDPTAGIELPVLLDIEAGVDYVNLIGATADPSTAAIDLVVIEELAAHPGSGS